MLPFTKMIHKGNYKPLIQMTMLKLSYQNIMTFRAITMLKLPLIENIKKCILNHN